LTWWPYPRQKNLMNDQVKSDVKIPELVKEGMGKEILDGQDLQTMTRPLQFKIRPGILFDAEVTEDGEDFIFHFYTPQVEEFWDKAGVKLQDRSQAFAEKYWEDIFPNALDVASRTYFNAEFPRLSAMHMMQADCLTEYGSKKRPLNSWWMRAKGFVNNTLDPIAFIEKFYLALEEALVNRKRM
jgi:hypothetical protein